MAIYALSQFRLDSRDDLLFCGAEPVALGKRPIALLRALLERPGALVSKEELIEAAWAGRAVEESNLPVQIAALRRVLGAAPGGERWIETLSGRGYRFVGPVVLEAENDVVVPPPSPVAPQPTSMSYGDAERRQITGMSCELVDLSAQANGLGLEDLHEAVDEFRRIVSEAVGRYNGFIARTLGNTALVLFGYPKAHEHDAEHAVRAGLELCATVTVRRPIAGVPRRCRVGIATGNAIVGNLQGGAPGDLDIVGDVPNLAAQLRISAQPDITAVDPTTRRLIGNLFDYRDLGALDIGGQTEPVHIWQVLGEGVVASRFEALRGSASSPLIGHDEEIDLLLRRWERVKADDGQVVLISGEAGIGKSRITAELETRLHSEPHIRLRYFCSPHHQGSALFPFIDQLRHAAGFAADDPPETRQDKLEALLALAAPKDDDVALLAELLSLPPSPRHPLPNLSPQRKKERILKTLLQQLEGLARNQPVLVVFEDAHWLDPTSRELLELAVEHVRYLPVMLVVTFRPEFQPPWVGQPQVTMVALNRLDRRERTTLVEHVAGGRTLPQEVMRQIVDRTDGVPLFVEELTKSVLESGALREEADSYVLGGHLPRIAVPATLHASLLARLDRLGSARHVAQIGAIIGREFSYGVLDAVSHLPEDELRSALADLVGSELVFQRGTPPDAVYSFKHALVQDAAYGTLLRQARQRLHARIAETLEAQFPELIETQPERVAQHYTEARIVEKSVGYWSKAGHRSAARSAMAEAAAQFQKALDQLAVLPDDPEHQRQQLELWSALGAALLVVKGNGAPEAGLAYARARELWERLGFPFEFLHIAYGQWRNHVNRGEIDVALRLAEEVLHLSIQRGDDADCILGHTSTGRVLLLGGRFAEARSHYEEVLALYDPIVHGSLVNHTVIHPHLEARSFLAFVLFCLGFPDQASAYSSAAIAEARRLAHPPSLASMLAAGTGLHTFSGDDAALSVRADEFVAATTERNYPLWGAMSGLFSGWAKIRAGDVAGGMPLLRDGLDAYRATGAVLWLPRYIYLFARACEASGLIKDAMLHIDEALQTVEETGERWFEAELHRYKGGLLLREGNSRAGAEAYGKALALAVQQKAKLWELRAAVDLARLCRDQDRRSEARDLLTPVYGWFTEGFDTSDLKHAQALLEELT